MNLAQPIAGKTQNAPSKKGVGCLVALGIIVAMGIVGSLIPNQPQGSGPHGEGCRTDWNKCADNADLANNYEGWERVHTECKDAATRQARFGTPKWPWLAFSSFYPGNGYVQSGIGTAIENDAQFSNGFGAMVHSKVTCDYDLRARHVLNVVVVPQ
jgi:hypothetical protein